MAPTIVFRTNLKTFAELTSLAAQVLYYRALLRITEFHAKRYRGAPEGFCEWSLTWALARIAPCNQGQGLMNCPWCGRVIQIMSACSECGRLIEKVGAR
jgi:hypothetical protein